MKTADVPPGWWGTFDCASCGHSEAVRTMADALRVHNEHRCPPPAKVVPLRPRN